MKEKAYKIKVSVSLDEDIIETIKDLAEQDDRNFSSYINKVLKEHIQNLSVGKNRFATTPSQKIGVHIIHFSYILFTLIA